MREVFDRALELWTGRRGRYRRVFESDDGRRVLAEMMRQAGMLDRRGVPANEFEAGRLVGRQEIVASVLNALALSDKTIVAYATDLAREQQENAR